MAEIYANEVAVNVYANVALDVDGVLQRLSEAVGAENDHQLSAATGTAQTTISTWRSKGRVPYDLCARVAKAKNITLDWLLFGQASVSGEPPRDSTGIIDIEFFTFCWDGATRIVEIDKSIARVFAAVVLYNTIWPHLGSETRPGSGLTRDQAIKAYVAFDLMGFFDWKKIAGEIKSKFDGRLDHQGNFPQKDYQIDYDVFSALRDRADAPGLRKRD